MLALFFLTQASSNMSIKVTATARKQTHIWYFSNLLRTDKTQKNVPLCKKSLTQQQRSVYTEQEALDPMENGTSISYFVTAKGDKPRP